MKEKAARRFLRRKSWKLARNRSDNAVTRLELDEMKARKVLEKD